MADQTFMGVPRDTIDWSPQIDYAKCNGCMDCFDFCPHQVYKKTPDSPKPLIVENPLNCVVFCRACGKTCGLDAITFPDKGETTRHIKAIRKAEKEDPSI
ncbi:NAD-dependent dihydropyrimidine dehydrogenase, PreA subunit [Eubacterium aggregans]|uniref:NAD-dependent dihydropyrimidine dehydrogenase, PreA subunit n=1 Tax=Eubacterium aggregans TaxID=81409 RepID=A0A1H4CHJ8_9FIRM|nr:ferredoxin family protein [Eubacterium aggregans]SEA59820.1 NAD-dependent dihydropyrimidine dehydrogenase, PreA subunit [Eubacterium aggregans]